MSASKENRYRNATLTVDDKLAILTETKVVLGRGGKNWIQGTWFGKRLTLDAWMNRTGKKRKPKVVDNRKLFASVHGDSKQADCFCLEGAVAMAAYRLGYISHLQSDATAADRVSLAGLIKREKKCMVYSLNDKRSTKWADIKAVIDSRIKELRREQRTSA